jgi:hypothetical protein
VTEKQPPAVEPASPEAPQPAEGTPVVVPHINFDQPTGNPQVDVRKGYGLTPPATSESTGEAAEVADG